VKEPEVTSSLVTDVITGRKLAELTVFISVHLLWVPSHSR